MAETVITGPAARPANLALIFQELFTAIVRLRANRQDISSADVFRSQVVNAIRAGDQASKAQGYSDEDVKLVVFALVAFLDESVLNLRKPAFDDWVRKPLQEELFGRHVAGETFFENLNHLLGRRDSPELADVIEVYYLCLLLGYLGRYSISSKSDLRQVMGQTDDKIKRIRGAGVGLSPQWMLPEGGAAPVTRDSWILRLGVFSALSAILVVVLFLYYDFSLGTGATALQALISGAHR
ncbi:MAG TPA: DotU family type IV/VI secretion system protein [Bryobacteraceae bacterium]|nr:DotU family type IV/VI secretion system protein [Bryobacteraceae bacterium]